MSGAARKDGLHALRLGLLGGFLEIPIERLLFAWRESGRLKFSLKRIRGRLRE